MDITYLPNNKLLISLNNITYLNCTDDFDCPGLAHCNSHLLYTWIGSNTTMCICPVYLGTAGGECKTPTFSTWSLFTITLLTTCICLLGLLIGGHVSWILWQNRRDLKKYRISNRFFASFYPTIFALFWDFLYGLHWCIRFCNIDDFTTLHDDAAIPPHYIKITSLYMMERVTLSLTFISFVFATNQFSLIWIEILSIASFQFTSIRNKNGIELKYRIGLAIYYVASVIAIMIFFISSKYDFIVYVALPGFIIVIIFYGIALYLIRAAVHVLDIASQQQQQQRVSSFSPTAATAVTNHTQTSSSTSRADSNNTSSSTEQAKVTLNAIKIVAYQVEILTVFIIIMLIGYAFLENRPDTYVAQFCGMFIFLGAAVELFIITLFLRLVVIVNVKKRKQRVVSNINNNVNNNNVNQPLDTGNQNNQNVTNNV
jgi:hypothetical protein